MNFLLWERNTVVVTMIESNAFIVINCNFTSFQGFGAERKIRQAGVID